MSEINVIKWLCLIYKLIPPKNKLHFNYMDKDQAQAWLAHSFPETEGSKHCGTDSVYSPHALGGFWRILLSSEHKFLPYPHRAAQNLASYLKLLQHIPTLGMIPERQNLSGKWVTVRKPELERLEIRVMHVKMRLINMRMRISSLSQQCCLMVTGLGEHGELGQVSG